VRAEGRFEREVALIEAPVLGENGAETGDTIVVTTDQGVRDTNAEALPGLPVLLTAIHTAGNCRRSRRRVGGPLDVGGEGEVIGCDTRGSSPRCLSALIRTTCSTDLYTPPNGCS
jgi:hypothetical protein